MDNNIARNTSSNYRTLVTALGVDRVSFNEPMHKHVTFKIGGPADMYYEAKNVDELVDVITASTDLDIPYFLLGGGSNVLVGDLGFRGIVIKNKVRDIERIGDNRLLISSGTPLSEAISFSVKLGLSGLEYLVGIPGTIGGAIRHNARFRDPRSLGEYYVDFYKVKDRFINDLVVNTTILNKENCKKIVLRKDELRSTYQESYLRKTKDVIISSLLQFQLESQEYIKETIRLLREWRKQRYVSQQDMDDEVIAQPKDEFTKRRSFQPRLPSAGCTFANVPNPENHPSGRLIDMCGLRGTRKGGAMIALEHANFIVNTGGATAEDVLYLINLCKDKAYERFGVHLREEIELVGEF